MYLLREENVLFLVLLTDLVPYFTQMPQSYISYPKLANAAFEFEIVVSFKPESPEGIVV